MSLYDRESFVRSMKASLHHQGTFIGTLGLVDPSLYPTVADDEDAVLWWRVTLEGLKTVILKWMSLSDDFELELSHRSRDLNGCIRLTPIEDDSDFRAHLQVCYHRYSHEEIVLASIWQVEVGYRYKDAARSVAGREIFNESVAEKKLLQTIRGDRGFGEEIKYSPPEARWDGNGKPVITSRPLTKERKVEIIVRVASTAIAITAGSINDEEGDGNNDQGHQLDRLQARLVLHFSKILGQKAHLGNNSYTMIRAREFLVAATQLYEIQSWEQTHCEVDVAELDKAWPCYVARLYPRGMQQDFYLTPYEGAGEPQPTARLTPESTRLRSIRYENSIRTQVSTLTPALDQPESSDVEEDSNAASAPQTSSNNAMDTPPSTISMPNLKEERETTNANGKRLKPAEASHDTDRSKRKRDETPA